MLKSKTGIGQVYVFDLNNGKEIIGRIVDIIDPSVYVVSYPKIIKDTTTFIPYLELSKNNHVILTGITSYAKADDDICSVYEQYIEVNVLKGDL